MVVGMAVVEHDLVFVGGGLAALLLLHELGSALPDRVADGPSEPITPFTLRLVRSTDVFAHLDGLLASSPIEWLQTRAHSITGLADGRYEIATDAGRLRATWVFDSATDVPPMFPPRQAPRAVESGIGVRVESDGAVFDLETVTLFDPLDESTFAYLLPLSPTEALLESASSAPALATACPYGPASRARQETVVVEFQILDPTSAAPASPAQRTEEGRARADQEPQVVPVSAPRGVIEGELLPPAEHVHDEHDPGREPVPEPPKQVSPPHNAPPRDHRPEVVLVYSPYSVPQVAPFPRPELQ
jgi:hypothetical protein